MSIIEKYNKMSLVLKIIIGLVIGSTIGAFYKDIAILNLLGDIFIGALKAIAPVLVFVLVLSSLAKSNKKLDSRFGVVIALYMASTLLASVVAVIASYIFPQTIVLDASKAVNGAAAPTSVGAVLNNLLLNMVSNPVDALVKGQYIGILFWAVVIGLAAKSLVSETTKKAMEDVSDTISQVVKWIINAAPFGIMGIVYKNVSTSGLSIFTEYGKLLLLLVGCMLFVLFVVNALIIGIALKTNPYPLIFRCIKVSGLAAFFTRSSAANIPVNMELCQKLGMDKEMYSVSIPLGATINMDGAAVTIAIMSLAAANTMGINLSITTSIGLALIATLGACGTSGVTGGSLMLIPMACSLFGMDQEISMQVVGVGFIIGVIQDSLETALNSSGDVMYAATAEYLQWKKIGKSLPKFLGGETETEI